MFFRIEPQDIALLLLFATAAFAAFKGGQPERWGAALIVAGWIGTLVTWELTRPAIPVTPFLAFDGLLAVGLLVVAVRYSSLWLGAAMLCEAVQFTAHALRLSDNARVSRHGPDIYVIVINAASYLVLLVLIGGTCATIARRRKADRQKVEDRARIVKRPDWLTDAPPPTAGAL